MIGLNDDRLYLDNNKTTYFFSKVPSLDKSSVSNTKFFLRCEGLSDQTFYFVRNLSIQVKAQVLTD